MHDIHGHIDGVGNCDDSMSSFCLDLVWAREGMTFRSEYTLLDKALLVVLD